MKTTANNRVADDALNGINVEGGNEIDLSDESDNEHLAYYQDFAKDIAVRQGKKIQLNGHNLAHVNIPARLKQPIKEISIQLLRNAVVHGIESPEARQSAGKSVVGNIDLEMQPIQFQVTPVTNLVQNFISLCPLSLKAHRKVLFCQKMDVLLSFR